MCEQLKENGGKCCGECDRPIECDICLGDYPVDEITKNYHDSGENICKECEEVHESNNS